MNVLFVHQNFPAQYKHLAPAVAAIPGSRVVAMHVNPVPSLKGIETIAVKPARTSAPGVHPWAAEFEAKVIRGEAVYRAAKELKSAGFSPDAIIAHPGWGENMFLRDLWPQAPQGLYCEYYYRASGADVNFDPEFGFEEDAASRLRVKNVVHDMQFSIMTAGISPTKWQRSTYPEHLQSAISVIHDGIDTDVAVPNRSVGLTFTKNGAPLALEAGAEVITFVVRNLEPYRGYHIFMRALPGLLRRRPNAQVLIVGGDSVSYGPRPTVDGHPPGKSWAQIFLDEVRSDLDLSRVQFLGRVSYQHFMAILQVSTVHVYLTYPFVLSWSLLEAMSAECAIVASDTAPVREAITHGETGRLVNFFDVNGLVDNVCALCEAPDERRRLGAAARAHAREVYDLRRVCLPAQMEWVRSLVG